MPEGRAVVLASSNARPGVPSANSRFPVPTRTGFDRQHQLVSEPMLDERRGQRGAAAADEVRAVGLLDTANVLDEIRPDGLERTPLEAVWPMGDDVLRRRPEPVAERVAGGHVRPEVGPHVVGATSDQHVVALSIRREHEVPSLGAPVRTTPVRVRETVVREFWISRPATCG